MTTPSLTTPTTRTGRSGCDGFTPGWVIPLILALVLVKQLAWLALVPLWQTPDEPAHFDYVQFLAETGQIPTYMPARPVNVASPEVDLTAYETRLGAVAFRPDVRQPFSGTDLGPGEERLRRLPALGRVSDGNSSAAVYGPGYYFPASLVYRLFHDGTVIDRVFAVRALSIAFVLITVVAAFAFAGWMWPLLGWPVQAAFSLLVGFHPMFSMLGVSVNNDAACIAIASLVIVALTRWASHPMAVWQGAILGLLVGLGLVTKPTMIFWAGAVPLIASLAAIRQKWAFRQWLMPGLAFLAGMMLFWVPWLAVCHEKYGALFPPLPGSQTPDPMSLPRYVWHYFLKPGTTRLHDMWVVSYWANFGWLDTRLPGFIYDLLGILGWGAGIGTLVASRHPGADRLRQLAPLAGSLLYLAFLYVIEWRMIRATGSQVLQGRYWLPMVLPVSAVLVNGAMTWIPRDRARATALAWAALAILLNLACLVRLVERYYVS